MISIEHSPIEVAPMVSVVMPVLNPQPCFLRQAIVSLVQQTWADFELIVVEDPGENSARSVLAEFADDRIRHIENPDRTSLVQQRNLGLRFARGEFVALLDADDICRPDRLQRQVEFLRGHPQVGVLGSRLTGIDAECRPLGVRNYPLDHQAIVRAMRRFNPIAQPSVMFRKQTVLDAGGYRYGKYTVSEDYDLWCRLAQRGVEFANLPEPLLLYRIHAGGSKASKLHEMLLATLDVKQTYFGDEFSWSDRLRCWGERGLSCFPAGLVLRLFTRLHYRSEAAWREGNRSASQRGAASCQPR